MGELIIVVILFLLFGHILLEGTIAAIAAGLAIALGLSILAAFPAFTGVLIGVFFVYWIYTCIRAIARLIPRLRW